MTNAEIKDVATRVLSAHLADHKLDRVEVRIDHDDPDEPSLLIEAFLASGSKNVGGIMSSEAHHALSKELYASGERRFPYLFLRYVEDDELDDSAPEHD